MSSSRSRHSRLTPVLTALAVVLTALVASLGATAPARADSAPVDPTDPRTPPTVSGDALPTAQINGVVWTQVVVGNTVYAGGSFTKARPAGVAPGGAGEVTRNNLLAYDIRTGALIDSFAPNLNAQVRSLAVSPDQKRLYVGGDFTTIDGDSVKRLAAFDLTTGQRVKSFSTNIVYNVHAVQVTDTKVFVGGNFNAVGTQPRGNLAAFTPSGALLDWQPRANAQVDSLVLSPDASRIAVGGHFTTLNGSSNPGYGLGMVDTTTGASLPLPLNNTIRNGSIDGSITSLRSDGTYWYGSGYTFGADGGNLEGVFQASWDGGTIRWLEDCHGDSYDVTVHGGVVYSVGHAHYCENLGGFPENSAGTDRAHYRAVAFGYDPTTTLTWEPNQARYTSFAGQPAPSMLTWFPKVNSGTYTGSNQGGWSLAASGQYVVMGGEFTKVNGVSQQGLTRFPAPSISPNKQGPTLFNATYPLNLTSTEAGKVRVSWTSNQDLDNRNLTYRVYRDTQTKAGLVYSGDQLADWWNPYTTGYTDTVDPGSSHQYRVSVVDAFGNTANSAWTSITAASSGKDSAYTRAVYASQPTDWWRFDDTAGTTSPDAVGFRPGTSFSGVSKNQATAISGDGGASYSFSGGSTGFVATPTKEYPPDELTVEAWIRTTTTRGGKIIGWGNSATGTSSRGDRHLYMDNAGRILFGVKPDATRVAVSSTGTYRDGRWHHVAGTLSKAGMALYVDGQKVAERAGVTVGEHLNPGYWRVGGDSLSGWPSAPSSGYFAGSIDEPAVYKRALSSDEIATHYAAGTGQVSDIAPVAAFSSTSSGLTASFDATSSTDTEGPIASYAWDFGDGSTGTGATASHPYAAAGSYDVRLTVTDSAGQSGTLTRTVQVTAPNTPPTADFSVTTDELTAALDATASSDAEGPITSWAWTFGDGTSGTGATTTHTWASPGTYSVRLTVTDAGGLTSSTTRSVTISSTPVDNPPVAAFSASSNGLDATFDASASSDEGPIASYSWDFGDGGPGDSGRSTTHTYAEEGTYPVTLTVTDGGGKTGTVTKNLTVSTVPPPVVADEFDRAVATGWGSADTGGAWSVVGSAANYAVSGGQAVMRLGAAGAERRTYASDAAVRDVDVDVAMSIDKAATGGGFHVGLELRRQTATNDRYSVRAFVKNDRSVTLLLSRFVGGVETVLLTRATGLTLDPGETLMIRGQATGAGPTTLRGKVWKAGTPEPDAWQGSTTDSSTSLQDSGAVGLRTYLSGSATNAPLTASFDHFVATRVN